MCCITSHRSFEIKQWCHKMLFFFSNSVKNNVMLQTENVSNVTLEIMVFYILEMVGGQSELKVRGLNPSPFLFNTCWLHIQSILSISGNVQMPQDQKLAHITGSHFWIHFIYSFTHFLNIGNLYIDINISVKRPKDIFKDICKSKAAISRHIWMEFEIEVLC